MKTMTNEIKRMIEKGKQGTTISIKNDARVIEEEKNSDDPMAGTEAPEIQEKEVEIEMKTMIKAQANQAVAQMRYVDNVMEINIMTSVIREHAEKLMDNDNAHWGDVAEAARIKNDLEDLYNRITKKGDYAEDDDPMAGCEAPEDEDKPMKTYSVNINGKKATVTIPED